ncbi:MAG: glycosyltransferase, partial [Alphaproteobacteria bacterium]|nr:glycosyltransferase [Alphaproteobacteria bacterium]
MKVVHLITGLRVGGAETMLLKLLTHFKAAGGPEGAVINLSGVGPMAAPIEALGIPVTSISMSPGIGAFLKLARLRGAIEEARADIVQTWMYHANLMGALALRGSRQPALIWGLRQTGLDPRLSKRRTALVARAGARMSGRVPDRIVCVSESARDHHAAMGYDAAKMVVIPNGFDLDILRPDPEARRAVRAELGAGDETPVIGLVARVDPQKDHATFFAAAGIVARSWPQAMFVLCGEGAEDSNADLANQIVGAGLGGRVRLLGVRRDVARVTAAFDLAVSSSAFGEGFSNALGEALCCAVPVAVTDVGEARAIVGREGRVVAPADPEALAAAIGDLLGL